MSSSIATGFRWPAIAPSDGTLRRPHVHRGGSAYLLDVQADLISGLNTRLVVPLMPVGTAPASAERLNPVFEVQGERVSMLTQFMAAAPLAELGPPVASLDRESDAIFAAIDFVHHGW